jgi:hypothetical protein
MIGFGMYKSIDSYLNPITMTGTKSIVALAGYSQWNKKTV